MDPITFWFVLAFAAVAGFYSGYHYGRIAEAERQRRQREEERRQAQLAAFEAYTSRVGRS